MPNSFQNAQPDRPTARPSLDRRAQALAAGLPSVAPQKLTLYIGTVLLAVLYVFSFNFVPETLREFLSALLALSCLGAFLIGLPDASRNGAVVTMVFALGLMGTIAIATLVAYRPFDDIAVVIRNFTGMILIVWALMQRFYAPRFQRFLTTIGLSVIALCIALPILNDPILRGGTLRMGSITSGNESLHPSAYLCVIALFWALAIGYLRRAPILALVAAVALLLLTVLFAAQASQVLVLFLFVMTFLSIFLNRRWNEYLTFLVPIAVVLAFMFFFLILYSTQESWDIYTGSGRIGAWLDRFQRLGDRSWMELLFGLGPNSDQFYGSLTWTGKATHSHNDFLNVALELGVIGLFAFITLMIAMVFAAPAYLRFFVTIVIVAPFLSGGILFKPTVAPIMALAIMHVRMMYDDAQLRRGGRPMRRSLFGKGQEIGIAPRPATAR